MDTKKYIYGEIHRLKNGEHLYFNKSDGGGAVCYKCNWMFLLFEIPQFGGDERYEATYFENQIIDLVTTGFSWT